MFLKVLEGVNGEICVDPKSVVAIVPSEGPIDGSVLLLQGGHRLAVKLDVGDAYAALSLKAEMEPQECRPVSATSQPSGGSVP